MTITEILEQAQALSPQERKELAKLLIDSLDVAQKPATGVYVVKIIGHFRRWREKVPFVLKLAPKPLKKGVQFGLKIYMDGFR